MRPTSKKQPRPDKSRKKLIIGSLVVIFIAALIIYFLRPFRRFEAQFPYYWAPLYNKTMLNYVNKRPSRQILYVTGPILTGKSRSMNLLAQNLTMQGRLVINLDAGNFWPIETFMESMHTAILRGLIEARQYISKDRLALLKEKTKTTLNMVKLPTTLDPQLAQPYLALIKSVDNIYRNKEISTFAVSQFFDKLEYFRTSIQPVLMIHNFDKLYSEKTHPMFDAILSRLARRNLYLDHVPVILEVRDSALLNQIPELLLSLDVCYTENIPMTLTENLWKQKYFTKSEWRKLYKTFDGNMGLFQKVYNDLLFGSKIDVAINNRYKEAYDEINTKPRDTVAAAKQLCRKDYITYSPILDPLIHNGYLLLNKNSTVQSGNRAIKKALCMK